MLKQKTLAALIFGCMVFVGASYAFADDSGLPSPPYFPPDPPTIGLTDTTETQTNETATVASATTTASTTSSGPADVALVVGLGVIAILSLRKYSRQKKYSL
ncbi:MAG TPA: hypothetical protein VJL27_01830 [Patescibacteria group bacterium]|nr:hypothetical protein [Patescibacteria group bacterium]